jgi:hypothetical protein
LLAGKQSTVGGPARPLWGAATAQREAAGEPRSAAEEATLERHLDASSAALGPDGFAAAAAGGGVLGLEEALAEALASSGIAP